MGKSALLLPCDPGTGQGRRRRGGASGSWHGGGREEGGNDEEDEGIPFPSSHGAVVERGVLSTGGRREAAVELVAAALGRRSGGLEVAGELWSSGATRRAYL